jgi:hypothetical protein
MNLVLAMVMEQSKQITPYVDRYQAPKIDLKKNSKKKQISNLNQTREYSPILPR